MIRIPAFCLYPKSTRLGQVGSVSYSIPQAHDYAITVSVLLWHGADGLCSLWKAHVASNLSSSQCHSSIQVSTGDWAMLRNHDNTIAGSVLSVSRCRRIACFMLGLCYVKPSNKNSLLPRSFKLTILSPSSYCFSVPTKMEDCHDTHPMDCSPDCHACEEHTLGDSAWSS